MKSETRSVLWLIAAAAFSTIAACGGSGTPNSPSSPSFTSYSSPHFLFRYVQVDDSVVTAAAAALEAEYPKVLADLGVALMPMVTITLYPDRAALVAAVGSRAGYIPSFATGLVTGVSEIHLVAAAGPLGTRLLHEFAHCVSMRANPSIPNNPRWLWETIAIYESESAASPRGVAIVTGPNPPTLASLNVMDDPTIYDVAFLLGEFIVTAFGRPALLSLLGTNGDVPRVLGLSEREFEQRWISFVANRS